MADVYSSEIINRERVNKLIVVLSFWRRHILNNQPALHDISPLTSDVKAKLFFSSYVHCRLNCSELLFGIEGQKFRQE